MAREGGERRGVRGLGLRAGDGRCWVGGRHWVEREERILRVEVVKKGGEYVAK